jgi:hypothetical protein
MLRFKNKGVVKANKGNGKPKSQASNVLFMNRLKNQPGLSQDKVDTLQEHYSKNLNSFREVKNDDCISKTMKDMSLGGTSEHQKVRKSRKGGKSKRNKGKKSRKRYISRKRSRKK